MPAAAGPSTDVRMRPAAPPRGVPTRDGHERQSRQAPPPMPGTIDSAAAFALGRNDRRQRRGPESQADQTRDHLLGTMDECSSR